MSTDLGTELLRELRYSLPDDALDRVRLAEACLRLGEVTPEDFPHVQRTLWYRDLWAALGGLRLVEAGEACRGIVQARELLLEVLRRLILEGSSGAALLDEIDAWLEFRAARRGRRLEGPLHALASELRRLRDHMGWRGTFEEDERRLPDSLKVLLLRAMIQAAWVDGELGPQELRLLTRKMSALELPPGARGDLMEELRSPRPLDRDLRDIEDYRLRLLLYRNMAAMVVADGEINLKENMLLGHYAAELRIHSADAQEVERELFALVHSGGLDSLLEVILGPAPGPEAPPAPASGRPLSNEERAVLNEAGELWNRLLRLVGERLSWEVARRLMDRLGSATRRPSLAETLSLLEPDATRADLEQALEQSSGEWAGWLDARLAEGLPGFSELRDVHWSRTGAPHLGHLLEAAVDPVSEGLRAVQRAGRELEDLEENPLEHLRRRGTIPFVSDPRNPQARLFVVPTRRELAEELRAREEEALVAYADALQEVLGQAEELRQVVVRAVVDAGEAYLGHVLTPVVEQLLSRPPALRRLLGVLARAGSGR